MITLKITGLDMRTIREIRRDNMRELASRFSSRAKFSEFIERSPSQVNQIIGKTPSKGVGHNMAQLLEEKFDLPTGWMDTDHSTEAAPTQPIQSNATDLGHIDVYESNDPLNANEVQVPFFSEIELAAGNGYSNVIEIANQFVRFDAANLARAGVNSGKAACCKVNGDSMEPFLPDGSVVAINTGITDIKDGKMYAINHGGLLRVKYLYRLPFGGVRIRSANPDYPDEELSGESAKEIRVIGKVFWYSAFDL